MKIGYIIEHLLLTKKKTISMNLPSHTMTCVGVGKNKYKDYLLFMNSWHDDYKDILGNDSEIRFPFSEELLFNQINAGYSIIFKWFVYMNVREILFFE